MVAFTGALKLRVGADCLSKEATASETTGRGSNRDPTRHLGAVLVTASLKALFVRKITGLPLFEKILNVKHYACSRDAVDPRLCKPD